MEPRPSHPRTGETPLDATVSGAPEPAATAPEGTAPFRPDYGPVARVPPTGDPINLRPAPVAAAPVPAPRRHVKGPLLAALAAVIVIALLLAATIATVAWLGSDDDAEQSLEAVGMAPAATREAELEATIADLEARIAAAASPSPEATPTEPPVAPTEPPPAPTTPAADERSGAATATAAPTQAQASGAGIFGEVTTEELVPSEESVPPGFVLTDDTALTSIEEVAGAFSDPDAAAMQLEAWGWEENASRTFQLSEDAAPPESGMTFLYVSVHRFGSDQAAQEALTYFADELAAFRSLAEAEVSDVGDTARGLVGPIEGGGEEGALYVQQGPYLLRIGTVAPEGAALGAAVDVAQSILDGAGS
jgi:hypothetical protein